MKNILVPVGNTDNAVSLLQYAIDFAKNFDAQIFLTQAFGAGANVSTIANINKKLAMNSQQELDELLHKVDPKGVEIKKLSIKAPVVEAILKVDRNKSLDLVILSSRSMDVRESVYLGSTSGSIVKQTQIPALIVPPGTSFNPYKNVLMAFKSGIVDDGKKLNWLKGIKEKFQSEIKLLLVKTPGYSEEDLELNEELKALSVAQDTTENATTYLGVLERFAQTSPELLVVFRRPRGFFTKLWESNSIPKKEFNCPVPLLVLGPKL